MTSIKEAQDAAEKSGTPSRRSNKKTAWIQAVFLNCSLSEPFYGLDSSLIQGIRCSQNFS